MITKNTKYALRAANPRVADRAAGGRPLAGRIIMTPYHPSSVRLITEVTSREMSSHVSMWTAPEDVASDGKTSSIIFKISFNKI
jgi:hypothetical protein